MAELKITLVNEDGESTVSGKAQPLPTPRIFPPPYFFRFIKFKTEGKLWDKQEFQVKSGKIEFNGEEFDIPQSKGSSQKEGEVIEIRLFPSEPAKKPFFLNH
ncbi:hypothetical protein ACTFIY_009290 [Dictyostelium cf. discoideum]